MAGRTSGRILAPIPTTAVIALEPSLLELLALESKGKIRRTWRRLTSPRRVWPTILVGILLLLYVAQIYIAIAYNQSSTTFPIGEVAPVGMLGILCMKLVGVCIDRNKSGAGFRRQEVHCLLGGPFSLQQVRLYRVAGHAVSIFFTSIFAAVFFRFHVESFFAALVGSYLAMLFTYLVYTMIAVGAMKISHRTFVWARTIVCGLATSVLAWLVYDTAKSDVGSLGFLQCLGNNAIELSQSGVGQILVSPFHRLYQHRDCGHERSVVDLGGTGAPTESPCFKGPTRDRGST